MKFTAHVSGERVQSVQEHCKNTAKLCAEYCAVFNAQNIGRLAGLLHDAGKMCFDFDDYINGMNGFRRGEIDHSYAGAKYITEIADKDCSGAARLVARIIISHHGLHDWVDDNCRDYYCARLSNDKNYEQIKTNISLLAGIDEIKNLLKAAAKEYRELRQRIKDISKGKTDCAFYLGMLERIIQSALIDADRTDTASFMKNKEISEYNADISLWQNMKLNMERKLSRFSDKTDMISQQRRSISDRCAAFAENEVHICRMIVPTGGGKTLSSLRFAVEYCISHEKMKNIIYTAPFMSILEQNSDEIRSIANECNFTEHHSNALAEIADDAEEYSEYELHTERWDKPVIATTMAQLLNTMFLAKSSSVRRFHRLAKSVLIIDEIQSLPLKCINTFDLTVNFLSYICGSAVVLCTATQPSIDNVGYPIILDKNVSMTGNYNVDFEIFKRTKIIPYIDPYGYSYETAADFCFDKFMTSGNLLLIVNTKSSALKLYKLLKEKCCGMAEVIHLSTNMCPEHRKDKISKIRYLLSDGKPVICVTTQLIEAGVDISFKCVVRSAAGIDNVVQAAGRCNRHGENDGLCPVYIIKLKDEKLGNLREIAVAQNITQQMTDSGKYSDISSPEAVMDYFDLLYKTENDRLSYSVNGNENLLNLLSLNKNRYETLPTPKTCSPFESQALKTAGTLFKVIDNNTQDVIVPYNDEAKTIIVMLESSCGNTVDLLRKAQKYTISIYSGMNSKLNENNAVRVLENGVVILEKSFYNDEFGVDTDESEKEILIY